MDDFSHRERKKIDTRHAISTAAESLFIKKGYAATTLQDIATEAGIAQRTIFSYFPSKEAIIFDHHQIFLDEFIDHVGKKGQDNIFVAIRDFSKAHKPKSDAYKRCARNENVRKLTRENPILQEYFSGMLAKLEAKFTDLIADEYGFDRDSIEAHLIASSLRTAFQYSIEHSSTGNNYDPKTGIAINFIEGGINNIQQTTKKNQQGE